MGNMNRILTVVNRVLPERERKTFIQWRPAQRMTQQPDNNPAPLSPADVEGGADLRQRRKRRAALLSIGSNSALVVVKFAVGILSGSVSVLSEAIHSITDLIASVIAFFSVRASDTPPDAEHPYGHGKIESISGLAEAVLILLAAFYIIYEAVSKLLARSSHPPHLEAGMIVMGVSALTNLFLSRYLKKVGRETDSPALEADGEHLYTDVVTSAGVFVGLVLTRIWHFAWLDPVAGLAVALLILRTAWKLFRASMKPLLDARLPEAEEKRITNILEGDARVLGYHKLRTRKSGSQRHADVHVMIDDDCTLVQAHDLTEELEDSIRSALPDININIHIEPYHHEMRHQREAHGLRLEEANPKEVHSPPLNSAPSSLSQPEKH